MIVRLGKIGREDLAEDLDTLQERSTDILIMNNRGK